MSDKRNSITGMPTKKADERTELNILTGVSQDVKEDDDIAKGDGKIWPSISDIDKRDEAGDSESEQGQVSKSTDEQPWPSLLSHLIDSESEQVEKSISKDVPIFVSKADQQIICGVIYEPDTVDAQGDQANADEIKKAAFDFMESVRTFKVMHKGKKTDITILESYIAPADFSVGKKKVKKGSWVITAKVNDKKVWKSIKDGKLTGFSMAGRAIVDSE